LKKVNKKVSKEMKRKRAAAKRERDEAKMARAKTQNGRHIVRTMLDEKIKGDFKDYVIIVGDQLLDWQKTMTLTAHDGMPVRVDKPVLIHKSKLKNIISPEAAKAFWHPVFGRLVDISPATKTKGK
jgi:hypothetical protein